MATLFIIAPNWRQPKVRSPDERISKMWYIHSIEYYSADRRGCHAVMRMALNNTMLSEKNQAPKATYRASKFLVSRSWAGAERIGSGE